MKELEAMIGQEVVVETIGMKEVSGKLTEVEALENGRFGSSYIISIDEEIIIPMHAVYRITLETRHAKDEMKVIDQKQPKPPDSGKQPNFGM